MSVFKEFRDFALKGNVVDLAVGVIIGAAFGTIVTSLVNDVIMPPIGLLIGGIDFSDLAITLREEVKAADGTIATPGVVIGYGKFINAVISFAIVAWVIFLLVKGMNTLRRKEEEKPAAPPPPTPSETLLAEIRDLLKNR
ncbi:MAG: large-conductance mechanosensitive channel protein MscL [Hydrogenophilaceae bacterium]|jgi:large conductance mechanosensitive channel|nr:large-conductance mechanosensitive channel protein MscL [Hydrogenophilaceae bacterium]